MGENVFKQLGESGVTVSNPLQVALEKHNLSIVRMLVIAGCPPMPLSEFLIDVPATCWSPDKVGTIIWMKNFTQTPVSLGHACRLAIRCCMGLKMPRNINCLPLPHQMKDFIMMKELDKSCDDALLEYEEWAELAEELRRRENAAPHHQS